MQDLGRVCAAGGCGDEWLHIDTLSAQATLKMTCLSILFFEFALPGALKPGEEEAAAFAQSKAAQCAKLFEPGQLLVAIGTLPTPFSDALLVGRSISQDIQLILNNTFRADDKKQLAGFKISAAMTVRAVQGLPNVLARAKSLAETAIDCQKKHGEPTLSTAKLLIQSSTALRVPNPAKHLQPVDPKAPKLMTLGGSYSWLTETCLLARSDGAPFTGDIDVTGAGRAQSSSSKVPPSPCTPPPARCCCAFEHWFCAVGDAAVLLPQGVARRVEDGQNLSAVQ
jgi:hypothetical protein